MRSRRSEYLSTFDGTGVSIAGLNCNGNPLHPDPEVGPEDAEDLRNAIRVAGLLGVDRVVTMSGLPQAHPGGQWPAWHVNTWDSGYLDSLDYQWDDIAVPFWTEIDALARENGVKVAIEMHPQNLVFNPPTLKRLVDKTGATTCRRGDGPVPPVLAGHRPGRGDRMAGPAGVPRRSQGHPHQRQLQDLRRARRAVHPNPVGPEPDRTGRHGTW